ncbi:MAG: hypothetical protein H7256_07920 [Bdellovibrio sp.]|nr:hypothetical protein [Bdellovibrio sp.]
MRNVLKPALVTTERFIQKFTLTIFVATIMAATSSFAANMCHGLFSTSIDKVIIPDALYTESTNTLRSTISGNLATVLRSEWKTKLSVEESNSYALNLMNQFLTSKTRKAVTKGLSIKDEGFTRKVHSRLFEMQTKNLMSKADKLSVRDKPAPAGATDTTFTFYTKPLKMESSDGKHQLRVRTYLREVEFSKIPVNGEIIRAYDVETGNLISFSRTSEIDYVVETMNEKTGETEQTLTHDQIVKIYGETAVFYAPHGKSYKLEIKTALEDQISAKEYERLRGKHMVQKLDTGLTPGQVVALFAPLKSETARKAYFESTARLVRLTNEMIAKKPENKDRIVAVMTILKDAIEKDPFFLTLVGATHYNRTAFETSAGLQTTIDRDQGVYEGNMYGSTALKNPVQAIQQNVRLVPKVHDARHVELKIPITYMQNTVGITYVDASKVPAAQASPLQSDINQLVSTYHDFVRNALHAGKFNYIRANGESEPAH